MMLDLELCVESVIILLLRLVLLSVMILSRIPYRQIRLCLMNRATTFLVTEANDREVIDGNQDEAVPIKGCRSNPPDHIDAPHCKWPGSSQDV